MATETLRVIRRHYYACLTEGRMGHYHQAWRAARWVRDEAKALLSAGVSPSDEEAVRAMLAKIGPWLDS